MNTDKKEIQKRIEAITHQKYEIEQELLTLQKEYNEIFKDECELYIGKCYKQDIEDEDGFKTVYYRVLNFYNNDETDSTYFWVLVVEEHVEEDINIPLSYIHKEYADLLGHNKFFLRQLTPISEEEFSKALDEVYKDLVDMNNKVPVKEVESFKLKCPNCNSLGPLSQGVSMTTAVYYPPVWENGVNINPDGNTTTTEFTCEKCGCKFSAIFKHGECISVKEN